MTSKAGARPTIEWTMSLGQQDTQFKTFYDTPFTTVWKAYVQRRGEWTQQDAWRHRLYHNGEQIDLTSTPESIKMQPGDKVSVIRLEDVSVGSWA